MNTITRSDKYNRFQPFKILRHSARVEQIIADKMPAPVEWVIYPSNICGYQCSHCIMAEEHMLHKKMLTKEAMLKIPADAAENGIKCVIFSGGGDPLLNRYTYESARRLQLRGVLVGLNNQGYLLDDPRPFDFIRYSVDAATPETYQKIHRVPRNDGWERVNANIKRHADYRKKGYKIEMGLAFLITPWNWEETEMFVEWAQQYEPDFIHIRPAYLDADYISKEYPGGGEDLQKTIIPSLRMSADFLQKKYGNVYFRVDKFEGYWTPKQYEKCRATPLMAVTSGDGAFIVCQDRGINAKEEYLRWGDYNTQSFRDIWWSKDHTDVIESIDLPNCPRCVMNGYNEIIEHGFVEDKMRMNII